MFQFRFYPLLSFLILCIILWAAVSFIYTPILSVLHYAFFSDGAFSLNAAKELAASRRVRQAIENTLIVSLLSLITVNIVGIFQAAVLEYFKVRGRGFLRFAYSTPLIFVSIAAATGYGFVYGPTGIITRLLQNIWPNLANDWFTGIFAVVFAHSFLLTSFHFLFLRAAMRRLDYSTIEAARSLGASHLRIFIQIVLPVLLPTIFAISLLVLYKSLNAFAIPAVLGGRRFDMIAEIILTLNNLRRPDMAAMLSIGLGIAVFFCIILMRYIEHRGSYIGGSKMPIPIVRISIQNPLLNMIIHGLAYLMACIQLIPIILVVLFSFAPANSIMNEIIPSTLTLNNYKVVFFGNAAFIPLKNSLIMGTVAIFSGIFISLVVVNLVHRVRNMATTMLDLTFMLPWTLPISFTAIGLILAYSQANILIAGQTLIGTYWILPIGYTIMLIPITIRFLRSAFFSLDPTLNEAARSLGASPLYRFVRVTLPIILPVIILIAGMNMSTIFSEYSMSAFLFNINNKPLSIALFDGARSTDPEQAAISLIYITLIMSFSLVIITLADKYGLGKGHGAE